MSRHDCFCGLDPEADSLFPVKYMLHKICIKLFTSNTNVLVIVSSMCNFWVAWVLVKAINYPASAEGWGEAFNLGRKKSAWFFWNRKLHAPIPIPCSKGASQHWYQNKSRLQESRHSDTILFDKSKKRIETAYARSRVMSKQSISVHPDHQDIFLILRSVISLIYKQFDSTTFITVQVKQLWVSCMHAKPALYCAKDALCYIIIEHRTHNSSLSTCSMQLFFLSLLQHLRRIPTRTWY